MFENILALNSTAMSNGSFEVAYHLLAAALHAGERNTEQIDRIIALAEDQAITVDARHSDLSSDAAARRGTQPLFRSLIGTARAMRAGLNAEAVRQEHLGH